MQKPGVGGAQTKGGRLLLSLKTPLGGASIPSLARLLSIMSYCSRNVLDGQDNGNDEDNDALEDYHCDRLGMSMN